MRQAWEMDVDEYRDTMEDIGWKEHHNDIDDDDESTLTIDELLKEHRIRRIKAVMIIGDAAYAYQPPAGAQKRLTQLANTLGVTEQALIDWFMEN